MKLCLPFAIPIKTISQRQLHQSVLDINRLKMLFVIVNTLKKCRQHIYYCRLYLMIKNTSKSVCISTLVYSNPSCFN